MSKALLVGSPNSGKSTLFNWMTGKRQKVVNYPGSTVDYVQGDTLDVYGDSFKVYDTPGTYSLEPQTPEEEVTIRLLSDEQGSFNCIVAVIDMTQIYRQAPLIEQLKKIGKPLVVALTMHDLYQRRTIQKTKLPDTLDLAPLIDKFKVPVVAIDGLLGKGVQDLVKVIQAQEDISEPKAEQQEWTLEDQLRALREAEGLSTALEKQNQFEENSMSIQKRTEKLDEVLLSPVFGLSIFIALMSAVFISIFWFSVPLMDLVDEGFSILASGVRSTAGEGLLADFLADGLIGSMAAVMVFVPQIFILFFLLAILEESGYLARAATLVDRPLSWFGLSGRSFVPMLSGFACAVPAVMAARTISDKKIKWLTVFIIPFMTCSARLPVYALLISFLFYQKGAVYAGLLLAALYFGGLVISLITSAVLSRVMKMSDQSLHVLELPYYRTPNLLRVLKHAFQKSSAYVRRAGPIIFVFAVIIWTLSTFPRPSADSATPEKSYMVQIGQQIEPVFKPMGGDWRVGVGLISAFAAREVFVSTLAILFNITEDGDEDSMQENLLTKMRQAQTPDGYQLFNLASIAALLVFFMIALQCMSTVGVVYKEMNSWKYAAGQLVFMNFLGYLMAVLTYQLLI